MSEIHVRPVGDAAVTLEWAEGPVSAATQHAQALDRALNAAPFEGFRESVPAFRSLLVVYDPAAARFAEVADDVQRRACTAAGSSAAGALHVVPVRYGGEDGPDLPEVASRCGLSEADVVARHLGREYVAAMIGFLPGFAYLGALAPELELPRRETPRARVPAGSVAVAGRQTAVYPCESPGGWHLIGRTGLSFFDARHDPPARVRPGDRVRFVAARARDDETPDAWTQVADPKDRPTAPPAVEVVDGGWSTTVQDGGRAGFRRYGVPWSGPLDAHAHAAANLAVGNDAGEAALECTLLGPTLRFLAPCAFGLAGADLQAVLERADLGPWEVPPGRRVLARPGNLLRFGARRAGCRAYLAFAGGVDVPPALGSRSTELSAAFGGFEGRALRAGDRFGIRSAASGAGPEGKRGGPPDASRPAAVVRVVLGPQDERFGAREVRTFFASEWGVTGTSDRVGCRLAGPRLAHDGPAEIATDGLVPGCIQVPPDGQPIVALAGGPTTGGYPKIATVVTADLPLLAQLVPGADALRFVAVSIEEAQAR